MTANGYWGFVCADSGWRRRVWELERAFEWMACANAQVKRECPGKQGVLGPLETYCDCYIEGLRR